MPEPEEEDLFRVEANADKSLFVSMLTKDIELLPAIMDLIDNSVDSARATSPEDPSKHTVKIKITRDSFAIEDDCGGIDLTIARRYAFRFGRPSDYQGLPGSVGQFGVGMKRALFKLGSHFNVDSRSATTAFELDVDVDDWLAESGPDWQFKMKAVNPDYDSSAGGTGTRVTVTKLHSSVTEDFENSLVLAQLREQIRLRHQGIIELGLRVILNGQKLRGFVPALMVGPDFAPINKSIRISTAGKADVFCKIIAGLAESAKAEDSKDDGDAEDFRRSGDAGWWLFCNDRLLLIAERTRLTGWGDAVASYHPQYRRFRGYVYLTSLDSSLLPWNTTKTNVDQDSRIWRQVQGEMKSALVEVISVINRLKKESESAETAADMPLKSALEQARPIAVDRVPPSATVVVPEVKPTPQRRRQKTTRKISYEVEKDEFLEVAELLDVTRGADVGRITFDYFYEREVDGL